MSDVATELAMEANDKTMQIARLKAENDTLRTQLADVTESMGRVEERCAKLRELVRDMWDACPADGYYCIYHCKHYDKESESHCKLEDRMRELGVEVEQ